MRIDRAAALSLAGAAVLYGAAAEPALRWRVDGSACKVNRDGHNFFRSVFAGLILYDTDGAVSANCDVPLQTGDLDITTGSSELLDYVSLSLQQTGTSTEDVAAWMYAHDYADYDWCECDYDLRDNGTAGYFSMALSYAGDADSDGCDDCPGIGAAPATWSVLAGVGLYTTTAGSNTLTVKAVSIYDQ